MANNLFKNTGSPPPDKAVPGREQTPTVQAETSMQQAVEIKAEMVSLAQQKAVEKLAGIASFNWKDIPPPMLAQMLIQIPFKGATGEPDYYLQPFQAMIFAMRCFELGLSPFSNEVWFNPKVNKVNVTFEGKLKLARMNGMNLSPPVFERIPVEMTKPLVAYKCSIQSPQGPCQYTAYLKDWQVLRSPVWKEKPEHMLQLRAAEKCLSFATGSGASEMPGEQDLEVGKEAIAVVPEIKVTEFKE